MTQDLLGKSVFVTGGAGGLGRSIAKVLAARGAHITLFSRRSDPLAEAREEVRLACASKDQDVNTVTVDMGDAQEVEEAFKSQLRPADILYCAAGGNYDQNGFFVDLTAKDLENCMRNNYFSAAYAAKIMMQIWLTEDASGVKPTHQRHREIIFINSCAAFLGLPGSIAYTTSKTAVRALADTLRMEVLRHNCADSKYSIHIAFPGDFVSPGFMKEQQTKVPLNKKIQGLEQPIEQLLHTFPTSDKVASLIVRAADRGDFIICEDSFAANALFSNMLGPSPKRGWGVFDALMSPLMGWIVAPYLRWKWEGLTKKDGEELRKSKVK
ncbi:unnamed protein product [Penicillium palitans]